MSSEEEIRPWYYAWTLMCRYFPKGCDIYEVESSLTEGIRICAAQSQEHHTVAFVNWSSEDKTVEMVLPYTFSDARVYIYEDSVRSLDADGRLLPAMTDISGDSIEIILPSQSLVLLTDME